MTAQTATVETFPSKTEIRVPVLEQIILINLNSELN